MVSLIYKNIKKLSIPNLFCFVRQLVIFYPFPLPSKKKREEEKEIKVAKPILTTFFQDRF